MTANSQEPQAIDKPGSADKLTVSDMRKLKNTLLDSIQISNQSKADYMKKFSRVADYSMYDLLKYIKDKKLSKTSYYTYKAAYQYGMALKLKEMLKEYNRHSRIGDKEEATEYRLAAIECSRSLLACGCDYQHEHFFKARQYPSKFPGPSTGPKAKKTNSKRRSLKGLPDAWQHAIYSNVYDKYKDAVLALMLTGCRPDELRKGIKLSMEDNLIKAVIQGSKVSGTKGHDERTLYFDPDCNAVTKAFQNILVNHKEANVMNIDLGDNDQANTKNVTIRFARAIQFAAQKAGNNFKGVAPYSFRHQIASNLKKEGHDQEKIAAFLGHRTTRMQQHYGFQGQGKGSTGIIKVVATYDIKPAAEPRL